MNDFKNELIKKARAKNMDETANNVTQATC